jgi:selenocysteine-specific elongation factor
VPRFDEVLAKLPVERQRALKLLQILLGEKVLVRVGGDLIFHRSAVSRLRGLLTAYKQQHGPRLPIAAFKELTAVSRKYAIPLLEFLDRQGLTRRAGDERVIL